MNCSTAINWLHHSSGKLLEIRNQQAISPGGIGDYIIVTIAVLILIVAIILCIKFFLKPGEMRKDHIKRVVLEDEIFIEERKHHE